MTELEEIRLGPSRIAEYLDCGHRYYIEHVLKIPRDPKARSLAIIEGATMHRAIETIVRSSNSGSLITKGDLAEWVQDEHVKALADGFKVDDPTLDREALKFMSCRRAKQLAGAVLGISSKFLPVLDEDCEMAFEFSVPPHDPASPGIRFAWKLDTYSRANEALWEWKSSTKRKNLEALPLQDALYARGIQARGLPLEEIVHATVICPEGGTKDAFVETESFPPPLEADYAKAFGRVGAVATGIARGVFVPARQDGPSAWVCTPKYCMRWNQCRFGSGTH